MGSHSIEMLLSTAAEDRYKMPAAMRNKKLEIKDLKKILWKGLLYKSNPGDSII